VKSIKGDYVIIRRARGNTQLSSRSKVTREHLLQLQAEFLEKEELLETNLILMSQ
jgi:hypothetical protein